MAANGPTAASPQAMTSHVDLGAPGQRKRNAAIAVSPSSNQAAIFMRSVLLQAGMPVAAAADGELVLPAFSHEARELGAELDVVPRDLPGVDHLVTAHEDEEMVVLAPTDPLLLSAVLPGEPERLIDLVVRPIPSEHVHPIPVVVFEVGHAQLGAFGGGVESAREPAFG